MEDRPGWVPDGVDVTIPNAARVYDYALGGYHNFTVDREFFHQAELAWPNARMVFRANRAFLGRAVRWLARAGIDQFLDIGSGIPTLGNVHEVAQDANPRARVVYVDIDPVAVEQSKAMLAGNRNAAVIRGDLLKPDDILSDPTVTNLLDFSRPVAVLLIAVVHFVPDSAEPARVIRTLTDALAPGSYVALSHASPDPDADRLKGQEEARRLYERTPTPVHFRAPEQLVELLGGLDLVPPGVVATHDWYPDPDDDDPPQPVGLAVLGRRP